LHLGGKVGRHPAVIGGDNRPRPLLLEVDNIGDAASPAERVIGFCNQCGTAEWWIKEGKNAIK
jgi:hypothetical protein